MTEITDRARAIAAEAMRQEGWGAFLIQDASLIKVAARAAQLALDGWEPVDPDLEAAREIVASRYDLAGLSGRANEARAGVRDLCTDVETALAAYKAGRAAGGAGK